ncbi:hypothetical protein [Mycolicibacterium sp. S2-37]|uniref:hypothetical protein n=1 Tax=Mycolicibacterium sp. S2-37 TaxID=2810297 RepID=UPI001F5FD29B|nr:hypothetical protein [Mycolicibacterium sp. S2-37]
MRSFEEGTPDPRVHGLRVGESGFIVRQHRDRHGVDVVDINAVSPGSLGQVIADTVGLVGAGAHPRIAVTGCGDHLPDPPEMLDEYDDFGLPIYRSGPREPVVPIVDGRDVVAIGTVQSRSGPAQHWGTDPERQMFRWVQISGDGDYFYPSGGAGYAEPLDAGMLSASVDGLIANALATVRVRQRWT